MERRRDRQETRARSGSQDRNRYSPSLPVPDDVFVPSFTCLDEVVAESVDWLWGDVIPKARVTLITGESGVGKSVVSLDIVVAVTRGKRGDLRGSSDGPQDFPVVDSASIGGDAPEEAPKSLTLKSRGVEFAERPCHPADAVPTRNGLSIMTDAGEVLLVSPEDELVNVTRPRLEAAGADTSRVHVLRGIQRRNTEYDDPADWLEQLDEVLWMMEMEIEQRMATKSPFRLIVIDPFPVELFIDRFRVTEMKEMIERLDTIAVLSRTAILLVATRPKARGGDSEKMMRFLEASIQSAWKVVSDLDQPERKLLLPIMTTPRQKPPGRAFLLCDKTVQWEPVPVCLTAEQHAALERPRTSLLEQESSELFRATEWLQRRLKEGVFPVRQLKEEAAEVDISFTTLRRAFCGLKGVSHRSGNARFREWALPQGDTNDLPLPQGIKHIRYEVFEYVKDESHPETAAEAHSDSEIIEGEEFTTGDQTVSHTKHVQANGQ